MNVRCPECKSVFRVDPEKVPIQGVRARCARCRAIFSLSRSGVVTALSPLEPGASGAHVQAASPADQPAAQTGISAPPPGVRSDVTPAAAVPTPDKAPEARTEGTPATVARPAVTAEPGEPRPVGPAAQRPVQAATRPASTVKRASFAKLDPNVRAQRLARALVSDIVAYNKDKREAALQAGTLRNEFREEIRKSWEEYVAQVGLDLARSTPFFRDSLNEILAKGQSLF